MLSKKQIIENSNFKSQILKIEAWGGEVKLMELNAGVQHKYTIDIKRNKGELTDDFVFNYIADSIVDEENNPMFTAEEIMELDTSSVLQIFDAAVKLSSLSTEETKEVSENLQ